MKLNIRQIKLDIRQIKYDLRRMLFDLRFTKFYKGKKIKIQIKERCLPKKPNPGTRIGSIQLDKEWDVVVLILLDEDLKPKGCSFNCVNAPPPYGLAMTGYGCQGVACLSTVS